MTVRLAKFMVILTLPLGLLLGLHLSLGMIAAAQEAPPASTLPAASRLPQADLPVEVPLISDTLDPTWAHISGDCVAFRDQAGGVYLHRLAGAETVTITAKLEPDLPRKVVISQGIVVWGSDRAGEAGLWGYYDPACSQTGLFGADPIGPFQIISRTFAHGPALSGPMLTYMAWAPVGMWHIALIDLDADGNGVPDATESGYDPTADDLWTRLSCCASWPQGYAQMLPDIYWGDDYKIVCWYGNAGGDHLACYDLAHDEDTDGVPDWRDEDTAHPWDGQFRVTPISITTAIDFDWSGVLALHRDLLVWTDARETALSGHDIYLIDLDLDDDGVLNYYDADFSSDQQTEFVLVNRPWHQELPDIWWPFVVWTDYRTGSQPDIYAYDLSLDSNGDGRPNWKDPTRSCLDPAEFPVVLDPTSQTSPELWDGAVVWEDKRHNGSDTYGANLQPVQPQPRPYVGGAAQEKAIHWLDQWTVHFSGPEVIPGYVESTGMISRFKSFERDNVEYIRRAWYPAFTGTYVVGFDYCHFGAPDQKRFLGRFGRGFIYDQGLALIARSMLGHPSEAEKIGRFMASFQNSGQLTTTLSGSFGFSFNGQGYWGEQDNFYDMDYLRGGANGWLGYGYLFYARQYSDTQFMAVMTRTGDFLLSQQVLTQADPRYGLFQGGYGGWHETEPGGPVEWADESIEWVSTEHNIDIYFFLRDLGQMTGDNRYLTAAQRLKENMPDLWDEEKGRLHQGMSPTGTLDTADALDAASWGAIYWTAVGDLERAKRSLAYADDAYLSTVTVSNTVTASPTITIWGYKPYTRTKDLVWSEGSLGVAMANLKVGYALANRCGSESETYLQKADDILAQMETMQALDPDGGLFYAAYPGSEAGDFPRAPSAAGTLWLLMVQQARADQQWADAFWSPDPAADPPGGGAHRLFLPLIMTHCP